MTLREQYSALVSKQIEALEDEREKFLRLRFQFMEWSDAAINSLDLSLAASRLVEQVNANDRQAIEKFMELWDRMEMALERLENQENKS